MGSELSDEDYRSRRRKDEDPDSDRRPEKRRNYREDESDKRSHRHRSPGGERPRRSRSPASGRQRSRDRRDKDADRDRRRGEGSEEHSRSHRRRHRDDEDDEGGGDERRVERRRHRSRDRREDGERSHRRRDKLDDRAEGSSSRGGGGGGGVTVRRGAPLPSQDASFAVSKGEEPEKPKEQANFGNTGVLAAASNQVAQEDGSAITLKYHEPPEARKPPAREQWRLFVFKGADVADTVELGARSCWLVGRDAAVADLLAEHPSVSKQHAALQFRYTEKRNEFGDRVGRVKPYLIDLESANGTLLNGERVDDRRYLELRHKDMIQFGSSTREYVLMLVPKT